MTSARPAGAACDRACLNGTLHAYVEALVARDPSRLPGSVRTFTENGQRLELGDGLWHIVTGKGRYALHLADTDRGQGQIAEVFKIERGQIGAVESVLHPVPYGMGSGWSTWEEAMSSRPRW